MKLVIKYIKGILLCLAISLPAWFIGSLVPVVGGPVLAILFGMLIAIPMKDQRDFKPGIAFTSKKILQLAVVLLGFGMNLYDILTCGFQSLPVILSTISISLIIAFVLQKLLRMPPNISTLIGVGSSICGGSAIAATAPVIEAGDEEVAQSISVIFLFNIIAAILFPLLGIALGLTNEGFAVFAGTAINDTSSVTAAAAAWDVMYGSNTLDAAAVIKLTRTLAIIPITLVLAFIRTRSQKKDDKAVQPKVSVSKVFPMFILFFVLASVITTIFHLSADITAPLKNISKFLIVLAMSAIGLNTNIAKLIKTGGKPILMGLCCWAGIALTSLALQQMLAMW